MKKVLAIVGVVVVVVLCIGVALFVGAGSSDYYSQIDNTKISEIDPEGSMKYAYTLMAYDENGDAKELSFKTAHELTEDAFIHLEVAPIRGVVSWEEVQYDELPAIVQSQYTEESNATE